MKLQVGCGEVKGRYKDPEWINLDMVRACDGDEIDILGDGTQLPFKDNVFEEVVAVHVLEHVTRDKAPVMLSEIYRVLKPGGVAYIEVPDFMKVIAHLTYAFMEGNEAAIHIWTTSVYGKNEKPGMAHYNGFYAMKLFLLFRNAGFRGIENLQGEENMISRHYLCEPVLLMKGTK